MTHNVHVQFEIFIAPIVMLMGGKKDLLPRYQEEEDVTLNPGTDSPSLQHASLSVFIKCSLACEVHGLRKFPLVRIIARLIVSGWSRRQALELSSLVALQKALPLS